MSGEWWGFIFLMVVLKVPIAYLAGVVWYACKAPEPPEPAVKLVEAPDDSPPPCPWRLRMREPVRPHRPWAPRPRLPGSPRVSRAYAEHE